MAASMVRPLPKIFQSLTQILGSRSSQQLTCAYATSSKKISGPAIVVSEDNSTIVCWHPEPEFPYEHSKPLPIKRQELEQGDSVLKVQYIEDYENRHRPTGPTRLELEEMFFVPKYEWLPKPRKIYERRAQRIGKERESI